MRSILWKLYADEYCTIGQLAKKYKRSEKWIRTQLDAHQFLLSASGPRPVVIVADAMFFGKWWGMVVMRDPCRKENLYWHEIISESPFVYQRGIFELKRQGFTIQALVVDGRKGVREAFPGIPIQMCQFHQLRIVTRYITRNPLLEAGKELQSLAFTLPNSTKGSFSIALDAWHARWAFFLREKTVSLETRRWCYTHRRLRSAYFSLKRNLPYLFTYEQYPPFHIPKTTNCLEGIFSHVKTAARIHRGLTLKRKKRLIEYLLQPRR